MAALEEAQISTKEESGVVTVTAGGVLSFTNCKQFSDSLKQASTTANDVIVDLRSADFVDTQVIQDLGRAAVAMINRGKRLKVTVTKTAYPLRVLKISGYDSIMDITAETTDTKD